MAGHDIFDPVSHPGRKLLFRFEHSVLDGTRQSMLKLHGAKSDQNGWNELLAHGEVRMSRRRRVGAEGNPNFHMALYFVVCCFPTKFGCQHSSRKRTKHGKKRKKSRLFGF